MYDQRAFLNDHAVATPADIQKWSPRASLFLIVALSSAGWAVLLVLAQGLFG